MEQLELTKEEMTVYAALRTLASKVVAEDKLTHALFESVLTVCDAWNITPTMMSILPAERCSVVLESLITKGMVRQCSYRGMPSFVPCSHWNVREVEAKEEVKNV